MPVRIPSTLPARTILERENIFVMGHERAEQQDIRPLRVAILNLMPTKVETETQLLRLLGNSALQVEITLLQTSTYQPKNTASNHLLTHYLTWEQVHKEKFDGLIPDRFDSRIDFMLEIINCYSKSVAVRKNVSFRYFQQKYGPPGSGRG